MLCRGDLDRLPWRDALGIDEQRHAAAFARVKPDERLLEAERGKRRYRWRVDRDLALVRFAAGCIGLVDGAQRGAVRGRHARPAGSGASRGRAGVACSTTEPES